MYGSIINNAAILVARDTSIEKLDIEHMRSTFEVNLYGPMRVVKHFLPLLTESDASVINISSEAGSMSSAYPNDYPYAISKTALNMFSKQLQVYVNNRNIHVLSIHPGWIKTDMGGEAAPTDPRISSRGIIDLIERKAAAESDFVDYNGKALRI